MRGYMLAGSYMVHPLIITCSREIWWFGLLCVGTLNVTNVCVCGGGGGGIRR